jgi:hypothetical protein
MIQDGEAKLGDLKRELEQRRAMTKNMLRGIARRCTEAADVLDTDKIPPDPSTYGAHIQIAREIATITSLTRTISQLEYKSPIDCLGEEGVVAAISDVHKFEVGWIYCIPCARAMAKKIDRPVNECFHGASLDDVRQAQAGGLFGFEPDGTTPNPPSCGDGRFCDWTIG